MKSMCLQYSATVPQYFSFNPTQPITCAGKCNPTQPNATHGWTQPVFISALPSSVRSAPSLLQFRRDLKTALHVSSVIVLFTVVFTFATDCNL